VLLLGLFLLHFGGVAMCLGTMASFNNTGVAGGKGFIALAAMILENGPQLEQCGHHTFRFCSSIAVNFAINCNWLRFKIPAGFYLALPYILTIGALVGVVGKAIGPASDGVPYKKES